MCVIRQRLESVNTYIWSPYLNLNRFVVNLKQILIGPKNGEHPIIKNTSPMTINITGDGDNRR